MNEQKLPASSERDKVENKQQPDVSANQQSSAEQSTDTTKRQGQTGSLPPGVKVPTQDKAEHKHKSSEKGLCPICGHKNRPGVLICENCGTSLIAGQPSLVGTRNIPEDEEKADDDDAAPKVPTPSEFTPFEKDMVLRLEIEGTSTAVIVQPTKEIILGRPDPNTGTKPDIDLTPHAGYRMGVSRRHAAIRLQDKQLNIADLGSSNGTYVNGVRLSAHWPSQINDGDEIRLGQMTFKLQFVKASPEDPDSNNNA
ncbi:MAG: FHA domain-containing protein [Chloroflexi bacterium]|nr:MAG: hypothetical protein CUN54_03975 [Phototrophicales bacterium]RMF78838.1 MAG: FHA domain-containing protein [Chloroflexota bacterium]